jgi:hypothetical protein
MENLHTNPVPETLKVIWYRALHDILPTKERLNRIRLASTELCDRCGIADTLHHRLTECDGGIYIWNWTRQRIAMILRTTWERIPPDWLLRPDFYLWPPRRHRAVLWILIHYMAFRPHEGEKQYLLDSFNYLRRARWKLEQVGTRTQTVGNYLCVLTPDVT